MLTLKPYSGLTSKLVVAFDIGTSYSSVSYCILEPGRVPKIFDVTRFPAQGRVFETRVPSLLYYDQSGNFKAAGAEVLVERITDIAEAEGWIMAKWWKLHLRPSHLTSSLHLDQLPPLPPGKSAVDVLTDFIRYLSKCAETHIRQHHPGFPWSAIEGSIEYILTHPSGWGGLQQQLYHQAMEGAGLISTTPEGRSCIHMLTDGEASLHFFVSNVLGIPDQAAPRGIVIIDAGGGIIDLNMFSMAVNPIFCKEIAPAECMSTAGFNLCHFPGYGSVEKSVVCSLDALAVMNAIDLRTGKLEGWKSSNEETIAEFTSAFDRSTKIAIRNSEDPTYIKVAGRGYNDARYGFSFGRLELSGAEGTGLFKDSYDAIVDAFKKQRESAAVPITVAFLTGGLSMNSWLSFLLESYFASKKIQIYRPNEYVNNVVANGAVLSQVLSHVDRENPLVTARVARATYGVIYSLSADDKDEQHIQRKDQWEIDPTGACYVPGYFEVKVFKGAQVPKEMEFQDSFSLTERDPKNFMIQKVRLVCYQGKLSNPEWVDQDESSFSTFCTIYVDLSVAARDLFVKKAIGRAYYKLEYRVIVLFGLPELQAYLAWKTEKGERRIPAKISYD